MNIVPGQPDQELDPAFYTAFESYMERVEKPLDFATFMRIEYQFLQCFLSAEKGRFTADPEAFPARAVPVPASA